MNQMIERESRLSISSKVAGVREWSRGGEVGENELGWKRGWFLD